jgi:hypothetical protein
MAAWKCVASVEITNDIANANNAMAKPARTKSPKMRKAMVAIGRRGIPIYLLLPGL